MSGAYTLEPELTATPRDADALRSALERGRDMQRAGRHAEALAEFERCLDIAPADPEAHLLAGWSNYELGRWEKGVAHARVAAAAAPSHAPTWNHLASGLRMLGRSAQAREAAQRALALDARLAEGWNTLGIVDRDAGRTDEARAHFRRALEIDPRFAQARMNLAACDEADSRIEAALEGYRAAEALNPKLADIPYNIGHLHHKATGRFEDAVAAYRKAIALEPGHAMAHHNLAHALFLLGRFEEAWKEYRWRPPRRRYETWTTQRGRAYDPGRKSVDGAHLVIVGEQGLGDMVFFLRFAPLVRARGATLDIACDARLHAMLDRTGIFGRFASNPRDLVMEGAREVLAADLPVLLSEEQAYGAPPSIALTPQPERMEAIKAKLAALGPPPYALLAWRAGIARSGIEESLFKELPIDAFGTALHGVRSTWISVQREPRAGETEGLAKYIGAPVHDFSTMNEDLEEALALMSSADYSIGVSNTNVHLRAATRPDAHVLVPFPPEWRWMASGTSRWFPGIRVYRQDAARDWSAALTSLAKDLRAKLDGNG